ncbi:MAG: imidazole glycerol phosphate synthase subunit HisH [Phycisphaerae bacterium SM23_33]|nr:MAG: imidazole glycerol phosphate synthase subunit HisH [Phycisphaerae bacterium SM23_33]
MIAIIDYRLGNLWSVKYALDRLGVDSGLTSDPARIAAADGVILPGVGAFGRAMEMFRRLDLIGPTREAALSTRPFMGICLGLQLLFSESQEHGRHDGLDILPGRVVRFGAGLTVPHMGWNQVRQQGPSPLFEGIQDESFFYFAHSYYVQPADREVVIGTTEYGGQYASLVQKGRVFAVQFHPEKSGPTGLKMLANFCKLCV